MKLPEESVIRVVVKRPGERAVVRNLAIIPINSDEDYAVLEAFQRVVAGYIERGMSQPEFFDDGCDLFVYCNEDGLSRGLPPNLRRPGDGVWLFGALLAVKISHGEDVGLTEDEAARVVELFDHLMVASDAWESGRPGCGPQGYRGRLLAGIRAMKLYRVRLESQRMTGTVLWVVADWSGVTIGARWEAARFTRAEADDAIEDIRRMHGDPNRCPWSFTLVEAAS